MKRITGQAGVQSQTTVSRKQRREKRAKERTYATVFLKEAQDKSSGQSPPKEVGRNGKAEKLPKREAQILCENVTQSLF